MDANRRFTARTRIYTGGRQQCGLSFDMTRKRKWIIGLLVVALVLVAAIAGPESHFTGRLAAFSDLL